jgi:hypothetical protein
MLCPVLRDVVLRWAARPHITGTLFFFLCYYEVLFLVIIFYLRWIGWVVSFAGTRRLCAWVRSNIVRRRVDWSGMARYQHHPRSAVSAVYTS